MEGIVRDVELCVVGAGVHGLTLGAFALGSGAFDAGDILFVDPEPCGLSVLAQRFGDCCTARLRSGPEDHVDFEERSLRCFADTNGRLGELHGDRGHPGVKLFLDHARWVWSAHNMAGLLLGGLAVGLERDRGHVLVHTTVGIVSARCVRLCLGEQTPYYPTWAQEFAGSQRVSHVFDRNYTLAGLPCGATVLVVGGGISAVQVACSVAELGRKVKLLARQKLQTGRGETSSDDWKNPKTRQRLQALVWDERRAFLGLQGDRGTVPRWELDRLEQLCGAGAVEVVRCEVVQMRQRKEGVELLTSSGGVQRAERVILATGLADDCPGWLVTAGRRLGLPFDGCNMPRLENSLEWGSKSGIYLHGAAARLVIGPYAANISGARIAAEMAIKAQ